jgi:pimeloyl-ACP methyl ester carboxylesterase
MGDPPVLLVPGMLLDDRMYSEQVAVLSLTHTCRVSDITRSDSIERLAQDILADAPSRFALVGLSMGGIVALEVYRQARERVTHLALLDTTPNADRPDRSELRLEQIAAVERGELPALLQSSLKPQYLAARNRETMTLLQPILQMGLDLGPAVFRRQSLALRSRRCNRDMLPSIDCPTLVLCGREDQLCPVEVHLEMAALIPRADLTVLSGTGHLSTMESPEAVTGALQQLLRRT